MLGKHRVGVLAGLVLRLAPLVVRLDVDKRAVQVAEQPRLSFC